ncbi:MAG: glutamate--tRNA ligase [Candidatus Aenigmarchaeota archaeon]|nr:glutamate--tRNA ligase [Candidatus Aenigmarchaeota archaeon]
MPFDSNLIRRYLLINATQHGGTVQTKSVLGMVLADKPELRAEVLQLKGEIDKVAYEINNMSINEQKKELDKLGGFTPAAKQEKKGLPELDLGREGFVVRFAPNPDGALHLGNARPAVLCDEYAKKYKGKMILRFDDTDPKIKKPEKIYYKWVREDLKWLGVKIYKEVISSKRLKIYYKYAEDLVKMGKAYVCTCSETWKKLVNAGKACPCRNLDVKSQQKRWKMMLSHKYKEGQAVLRIKTDLDAKNPAVREWPAMRIVDKPKHPLSKANLWPLYNFASAIDDHLLNVTHIFRGQEHSTNETKQRYVYQYFRWNYPTVVTLGRFSMSDMVLSKSTIREGIEKKQFGGWDAPSLGTLKALRRRGFQPQALRNIIIDIGPKPSDVTISFENLASYNRKTVDSDANRFFFVEQPKKITLKGMKVKKVKVPLHPERERGFRNLDISNGVYIEQADFDQYKGLEVRLKNLCNVRLGETSVYTSEDVKPIPKIQWVPMKHIQVRVLVPGRIVNGIAEMDITKAKAGDVVQFERFGFVSVEKVTPKNVVVVFGHK